MSINLLLKDRDFAIGLLYLAINNLAFIEWNNSKGIVDNNEAFEMLQQFKEKLTVAYGDEF